MRNVNKLVNSYMESLDWSKNPVELYKPIEYTLNNNGKRVRPALLVMACKIYDGDVTKSLGAAAAIEIFHNFTLLHDDIMDRADLRRGKPTVHKVWDENTAILSGDAMLIKAYQYLETVPKDLLPKVLKIFSETALGICEGQQYDMEFEEREDVLVDEYFKMIRLKTAILLAASLQIGALIGGASDEESQKLYDFGINIGMAFQLRDDYLDSFGDESTFGKKIGGDILCGKKTFMLINAIDKCSDKKYLNQLLNSKIIPEQEKIDRVKAIYTELKIDALCLEESNKFYQKAIENIDSLNIERSKKEPLYNLSTSLMGRNN